MSTARPVPSAAVRRATAALVLATSLFAVVIGIVVVVGAAQQLSGGIAPPFTISARAFLFVALPLMIIAVVVRWRLVGTSKARR